MYRECNFLGPQAVSFVERFIIQCPYFGGSTIGGSTAIMLGSNLSNWTIKFT